MSHSRNYSFAGIVDISLIYKAETRVALSVSIVCTALVYIEGKKDRIAAAEPSLRNHQSLMTLNDFSQNFQDFFFFTLFKDFLRPPLNLQAVRGRALFPAGPRGQNNVLTKRRWREGFLPFLFRLLGFFNTSAIPVEDIFAFSTKFIGHVWPYFLREWRRGKRTAKSTAVTSLLLYAGYMCRRVRFFCA